MLEALAIFAAGMVAGTINTVVGSGTLVTFPVLLAFGYSPVTANVSNSLGLAPGSMSGAIGYRRELAGQRRRAIRFGTASVIGAIVGAILLLELPASAFKAIVPGFIVVALIAVVFQPRLAARLEAHRGERVSHEGPAILALVLLTGVYGGYFGAAQGIMLLAMLGLALTEDLQRVNALKNVLTALVNFVAALVFIAVAHVAWGAAALLAGGAVIGGQLGARYGRRLPPTALRAIIVVVGIFAIVKLLVD
jgi:uncharacterized membrane protein YfcA